MFRKHMVPLTPKGDTIIHKGKGSQMTGMPDRGQIKGLAQGPGQGINDYAKATPMAMPQPSPVPGMSPIGMPPMGPMRRPFPGA